MTSHHPTTAELAAFRRRIHNDHPDADWRIGPDADCYVNDPPAAAWPDERREGIGYHPFDGDGPSYLNTDAHIGAHARREAAAMRTRTYEATWWASLGDAGLSDDLSAAQETYTPGAYIQAPREPR